MTNFEKIKIMSVKEAAEEMACFNEKTGRGRVCLEEISCIQCCEQWLSEEASE